MRCMEIFQNVYIAPEAETQLQLSMQSWKVTGGFADISGTKIV